MTVAVSRRVRRNGEWANQLDGYFDVTAWQLWTLTGLATAGPATAAIGAWRWQATGAGETAALTGPVRDRITDSNPAPLDPFPKLVGGLRLSNELYARLTSRFA
jgi:hypothetical protein